MHIYVASVCPQCRSTTLVATNQDDAWGQDHAINCGVCGRRVTATGLFGKGLQFYGSMDPKVWGDKLWNFAWEGVEPFSMDEEDRRREERKIGRSDG